MLCIGVFSLCPCKLSFLFKTTSVINSLHQPDDRALL